MLRIIATLVAAMALASPTAAAPAYYASGAKTSQLVEVCKEQETERQMDYCTGYVLGVFDRLAMSYLVCPSPEVSISQIMAVTKKYLNDRPEVWDKAPGYLVSDALRTAFPCAPKK